MFKDSPFSDPRPALTSCAWTLADEGHESGLAGQLTARGPEANTYWTLPLGLSFGEANTDCWLLIDAQMQVLAGEAFNGLREPNPATRFHLWVYAARPDVNAIVHTHPPAASALGAAEQPLIVGHMDATPFADDIAFLPAWPGLPTADREGEIIAGALQDKCSLLLAHHGILTCGRSVQEACFLAVFLERMARLQLDAALVGGLKPIDNDEALRARDFLRTDKIMNLSFDSWARRAARRRDTDLP
jgi:L-fuculose-phosphate aldolase